MATDTTEAAAEATTEAATEAAASAPGMPQLDFSNWAHQIFWLLIALVAIYYVLTRVALPRISTVLAERKGTITNDIAAAETFKRQAVKAEEAYDKALADARAEAQNIVAETKAEIKSELDAAIAKADAEIAARSAEAEAEIAGIRASAMENVEIVARDTAQAIVASMGGTADASAIDAAVAGRVKG